MIIAVDFDNVIHDQKHSVPGRRMGPPMPGTKDALTQLKHNGHQVVIFSVWGDRPNVIADWMAYWKIPYDDITRLKPNADLFIDDKAVTFTNWAEMMAWI